MHQVEIKRYVFRLADDVGKRNSYKIWWAVRHHHPKYATLYELKRLSAEACGQDTVKTRGNASPLQVTQNDSPGLLIR